MGIGMQGGVRPPKRFSKPPSSTPRPPPLAPARRRRPSHDRLIPALHVWKLSQIDLVALVTPCPADNGEIGDGDLVGNVFVLRQPPIQHAIQPSGFLGIALQAIALVLRVL